jgi:hypothetical protein
MLFVGVGRFSGKRAVGSIGDVVIVARNVLNRRRLRRDGQHWAKAGVVVQARHLTDGASGRSDLLKRGRSWYLVWLAEAVARM